MQGISHTLLSEHSSSAGSAGGPTDLSHDARLRRGLIDTNVSRSCALSVTLSFLFLVCGVPLSQAVIELRAGDDSSLAGLFQRLPTAENLRTFERELEQASYFKDFVQPRMQLLLSWLGRVGNKRAVIGQHGWLYYTPGLIHLAGPSFIAADTLAQRTSEAEAQPDPRPAIFAFARMLEQRGISLVVFPVPDKTMLEPYKLHTRAPTDTSQGVANNLGFAAFAAELRARGITVFEPAPAHIRPTDAPRFLVQDTHWTPEWMAQVAGQLAATVSALEGRSTRRVSHRAQTHHIVHLQIERLGDLVDMLKLPDEQTLFRPQTITIAQVQDENGAVWEPDPQADILLLGDSFTNVFSEAGMGWGEAAGLAPHLSLALGRSVDVIAQNDSGAFATRRALARALEAGEDRLQGKRVVIWELAARELSVGDWRHVEWPATAHSAAQTREVR